MRKNHLMEIFDLQPEEKDLKILIWSKQPIFTNLKNVTTVPVEQTSKLQRFSNLEYDNQLFDLSICENTLFDDAHYNLLGDDQTIIKIHTFILQELCRVAGEVRIFPITNSNGKPSKYLGPVLKNLQEKGLGEELREIPQKSHEPIHALLKVFNKKCRMEKG